MKNGIIFGSALASFCVEKFGTEKLQKLESKEISIRVSKFVDEELEKFYSLPKFYNARNKEDLIGELIIGLAPHTSAGITGRIIGTTRANVCFAHPSFSGVLRRPRFA